METFAARLGHAIRSHRHTAGLSQEKVGHLSELHPNYVGMVERGERNVTAEALVRLGQAIGVRASVILAELETMDAPSSDEKVIPIGDKVTGGIPKSASPVSRRSTHRA